MSGKGRCTTTHMYLPVAGQSVLAKTPIETVQLWAAHPVTDKLVAIRTWKDIRDLERAAQHHNVVWDNAVMAAPRAVSASPALISQHLQAGGTCEGFERIYLDSDSARGRQRIVPIAPAISSAVIVNGSQSRANDPLVSPAQAAIINELSWLAGPAQSDAQKPLITRGASQVAHTLFGDKARKDIVAATGAALITRGPSKRFPPRTHVVTYAALVADQLSADRLAELLTWPQAPQLDGTPQEMLAFAQLLAPLTDIQRHKLLEDLAVEYGIVAKPVSNAYDPHGYDYDNDYRDYEDDYDRLYDAEGYYAARDNIEDAAMGADFAAAEFRLATLLDHHAPGAGAHIRLDPSTGSLEQPHSLTAKLSLAGALTTALSEAGLPLPAPKGGFASRLDALVATAAPPAVKWQYPPSRASIHGQSVPGLPDTTLVLPTNAAELAAWGTRMHNCIGSYAPNVSSGESILVGVTKDDDLIANVELSKNWRTGIGWSVTQAVGPYNASLPPRTHQLIRDAVTPYAESLGPAEPVPLTFTEYSGLLAATTTPGHAVPFPAPGPDDQLRDDYFEEVERPSRPASRPQKSRSAEKPARPALSEAAASRAVTRALGDQLPTYISDTLVTSLAGQSDPAATAAAIAQAASTPHPPALKDAVALMTQLSPAAAWVNPTSAQAARELLTSAATGDATALERWDELAVFPDDPTASRTVGKLLAAWTSGTITKSIAAQAWAAKARIEVPLRDGSVTVALDERPRVLLPALRRQLTRSGRYPDFRGRQMIYREPTNGTDQLHKRIAAVIGTGPPTASE